MKLQTKLNEKHVLPSIEIIKRVMDLFLMIDLSTSMKWKRIAILNQTMRELSPALIKQAKQKTRIQHRIRCLGFASNPRWIIGPDPIEISQFSWVDQKADGMTQTGAALDWVADSIAPDKMPNKGYPPVMVLVSDGDNTDGPAYEQAIARIDSEPWGKRAVRLAIGIGDGYDRKRLELFTNTEVGVMEARNSVDLINYLRYATITVPNKTKDSIPDPKHTDSPVALPKPPDPIDPQNVDKNRKLEIF